MQKTGCLRSTNLCCGLVTPYFEIQMYFEIELRRCKTKRTELGYGYALAVSQAFHYVGSQTDPCLFELILTCEDSLDYGHSECFGVATSKAI